MELFPNKTFSDFESVVTTLKADASKAVVLRN